jgi:hypothetical protein
MIFNEEAGVNDEGGTVTGSHLTWKRILHLPKPLVELPTKV